MRGTHGFDGFEDCGEGIIPAYAGNTQLAADGCLTNRDHPRVCGEHRRFAVRWFGPQGSSPRMRGTQRAPNRFQKGSGIIPAYAGNTATNDYDFDTPRDHPRVCGEHRIRLCLDSVTWGSSPRMRGTRPCQWWANGWVGIIPAYAGNTNPHQVDYSIGGDHPRVCGEHPISWTQTIICPGSSPRMRGTPRRKGRSRPPSGIIPAYAGNTL